MKHIHFDVDKAGFYGAYWENKIPSKYTIIAMLGDDPEDHMAKSAVKWLLKKVLTYYQCLLVKKL